MKNIGFSKTTGNFYPEDEAYASLPADLVSVPLSDYELAMGRAPGESLDLIGGRVVVLPDMAPAVGELSAAVRADRDSRISAVSWRYERHARELRLGLTPTDDIAALDTYVQALADVPLQAGFPGTIDWPVAP